MSSLVFRLKSQYCCKCWEVGLFPTLWTLMLRSLLLFYLLSAACFTLIIFLPCRILYCFVWLFRGQSFWVLNYFFNFYLVHTFCRGVGMSLWKTDKFVLLNQNCCQKNPVIKRNLKVQVLNNGAIPLLSDCPQHLLWLGLFPLREVQGDEFYSV